MALTLFFFLLGSRAGTPISLESQNEVEDEPQELGIRVESWVPEPPYLILN